MTVIPLLHRVLLTLLCLACSACAPILTMDTGATSTTPEFQGASPPVSLHVSAAVSLTEAFSEIGSAFDASHPGARTLFNFAGSQELVQQLNSGAPVDVFASANRAQMDNAAAGGRIDKDEPKNFATNSLVVIYPGDNPGNIREIRDLADPGLKIILAAEDVPVGRYSLEFLSKASQDAAFGAAFQEAVLSNVVSYETNVRAVLAKIALGEGDAGIVYKSDLSGESSGRIKQIEIPAGQNVLAAYPIAAVNDSPNPNLAEAFIEFVRSPEGQAILLKYGFDPPIDE